MFILNMTFSRSLAITFNIALSMVFGELYHLLYLSFLCFVLCFRLSTPLLVNFLFFYGLRFIWLRLLLFLLRCIVFAVV
jgi:hypothetical protein